VESQFDTDGYDSESKRAREAQKTVFEEVCENRRAKPLGGATRFLAG
jgi:hypothetical protein